MKTKILLSSALITVFATGNLFAQDPDTTQNQSADTYKDSVNVAFGLLSKDDLWGGISFYNMEDIQNKNYNTYSMSGSDAFGGMNWNNNGYLYLVDGVPREATNVLPSEIEQITFLKGAQAFALYGSRAVNGVCLITTKRGHSEGLEIKANGNYTVYVPKSYPEYLSSAEYMTLYNEARVNDGLSELYSQTDIYNYASGNNTDRYPNVDFFDDDYVKQTYSRWDANVEVKGGGKMAKFYSNIGYYRVNDLINFGEGEDDYTSRLNIRGNIDLRLNRSIRGWINSNATFYDARSSNSSFWSSSARFRPNRVSPFISIDYLDDNALTALAQINNSKYIIDGKYFLGGSQTDQTNPFADMYAAGYSTLTSRQLQFDAGVEADLYKLLPGLKFTTSFAADYQNAYTTSITNSYASFAPVWSEYAGGTGTIVDVTAYGKDESTGTQNIGSSSTYQTISFNTNFSYNHNFGRSAVSAVVLANGYQISQTAVYHKTTNTNLGFQARYEYDHKYMVDLSGSEIYSAKLAEGNRAAFSPVATLGWRASEEAFLKDVSWLDNLKFYASYGLIHEDYNISDYYMYDGIFTATGTWWGWNEGISMQCADSRRGENEDLDFIKHNKFEAGVDASIFKGMVTINANYFIDNISGLVVKAGDVFPSYFSNNSPETSFIPYINYNDRQYKGFDFGVNAKHNIGDFNMALGLYGRYFTSENTKVSETVEYDYLKTEGKSSSALWGLECLGFYESEEDIANSPVSSFSTVKPGDLKYKDQNNDGVINSKDNVELGDWTPKFQYGINFTLKYKNYTLFVLGTGNAGATGLKSNSYYWVYGDGKYSEVVRDRWTAETAETAKYPRLTTLGGDNNFRASSFWTYKANPFYLSKVQITYDFPQSMLQNIGNGFVKSLAVYAYGADLLTISKEKDYLEMNVGSSPQCRSFNLGVKVGF